MKIFSRNARWILFAVILCAFLPLSACERLHDAFREDGGNTNSNTSSSPARKIPESVHLAFGNPSNASPDPNDENNFLIVGDGSAISYNNSRGTPNWVSWRTTRDDLGESVPRPDFRPDPRLPQWYKRIGYFDYSGSGYDRGHLVPSADRFADPRLNEETFLMTNVVPQTEALNQYPWQKFESYIRGQARRGFDAYQIAGVYGNRETLKEKVVVPTNCWKIVVLVPRGRSIEEMNERTRVIAVDMPNADGIEVESWESFRTTIRQIEQKTRLDFFADMSKDLQDRIETRSEIRNTRNRR